MRPAVYGEGECHFSIEMLGFVQSGFGWASGRTAEPTYARDDKSGAHAIELEIR